MYGKVSKVEHLELRNHDGRDAKTWGCSGPCFLMLAEPHFRFLLTALRLSFGRGCCALLDSWYCTLRWYDTGLDCKALTYNSLLHARLDKSSNRVTIRRTCLALYQPPRSSKKPTSRYPCSFDVTVCFDLPQFLTDNVHAGCQERSRHLLPTPHPEHNWLAKLAKMQSTRSINMIRV